MMASTRIIAHIVSVTLLSLTLLAGSASAECAWVLWIEETTLERTTEKVTWTFERNIHDTRSACESALPKAIEHWVKVYQSMGHAVVAAGEEGPPAGLIVRIEPPAFRRVTAGLRGADGKAQWVTVRNFYCFPYTLDPRGPKGK